MLSLHQPRVEIMTSGHLVSRASDYIIYSVEAKNIDAVVKTFGPCTPSLSFAPVALSCF
jgi:prephenate dehydrogenase (NADP+)